MNLPRAIRFLCLPALLAAAGGALRSAPPAGEPATGEGDAESEAREMSRMLVSGDDRKEELVTRQLKGEGADAIPVLALLLANPDSRVCGTALDLCGRLGAPEKPLALRIAALLRHPDVDVRLRAALALGRMGPEAADGVPELVDAMLDPSLRIQAEAARAVVSQDETAEAPLIIQLRFPSTAVSARAFDILLDPAMNLGPEAPGLVDRALIRALRKNGDPAIRRQAARVLGRIGITSDAAFFALLNAVVRDVSIGPRVAAALSLHELSGDRREIALRQLNEIRHHPDPEVDRAVESAIEALEKRK